MLSFAVRPLDQKVILGKNGKERKEANSLKEVEGFLRTFEDGTDQFSGLLSVGLHGGAFEDDLRWSVVWEDVAKVLNGSVPKNLAVVELVSDANWVHDSGFLGYLEQNSSQIDFFGLFIEPHLLFWTL